MRYLLPLLLLSTAACKSVASPVVVAGDDATREALFAPVKALAGTWELEDPETPGQLIEFHVTAAGSAVREVMFPGEGHEMTNMYTLDGNSIVMTHYCAAGNQPHMRATEFKDGTLAFRFDGVSDLQASEDHFMGAMTLVVKDEDHVEQHWTATPTAGGEDSTVVFPLVRVH